MSTSSSSEVRGEADKPVQVWLVDDNDRLRELIAATLENEGCISCTRQFDSPDGLLSTLASRTGPDVILLDIQMGEHNGLDALPAIKSLARETRVYMLTTCFDPHWHQVAMDSGASGYCLKSESMDKLVSTIRDRSAVGAPVFRRRRRPSCAVQQVETLGTANASLSRVAGGRKQPSVLRWFKRFLMI